jgi:type I restriction enzyme S subunit
MKNVALLKPDRSILEPRYLEHTLNDQQLLRTILAASRGGAQSFLSLRMIRDIRIPVPSMASQKQFAKLVEKIADTQVRLKKSLELSISCFNALLQYAFLGKL